MIPRSDVLWGKKGRIHSVLRGPSQILYFFIYFSSSLSEVCTQYVKMN